MNAEPIQVHQWRGRADDGAYHAFVDEIPVGLYRAAADGTMWEANPALLQILGLPDVEALRTQDWDAVYVDPSDREAWRAEMAEHGQVRGTELQLRRPDGTLIWVRHSSKAVRDRDGLVIRYEGVVEDITERREAIAALRAREELFRELTDSIREVFWVMDLKSGRLAYVSPAVEELWGGPIEIAEDFWNIIASSVHPEDIERAAAAFQRAAGGKGTEEDLRIVRPDGTMRWIRSRAFPVRDQDGQVYRVAGVSEDITERRQTELQLVETERLYRSLVEQLPVVTYRFSVGNKASEDYYVSPQIEGFLGYPVTWWTSSSWEKLLHPDDRERVLEADRLTNETGERFVEEYRLRAADGRWVWVRDEATQVPGEGSGRPIWQGVWLDVTVIRESQETLHRSFALLEELSEERRTLLARLVAAQEGERYRLAGDIHDDPVQVMTAAAVRLEMLTGILTSEEQRPILDRTVKTVQAAIDRLRRLVFELRPPALEHEGLAVAIRQYAERITDESGLSVRVETRMPDEPPLELRTTAYRIAQEALSNVRKHSEAGNAEVLLEGRDGGVFIRIVDDGVGFMAASTFERARPGHLGLQAMKERAEAIEGWCRVQSEKGQGTTVEFWLPAPGPPAQAGPGLDENSK